MSFLEVLEKVLSVVSVFAMFFGFWFSVALIYLIPAYIDYLFRHLSKEGLTFRKLFLRQVLSVPQIIVVCVSVILICILIVMFYNTPPSFLGYTGTIQVLISVIGLTGLLLLLLQFLRR